MDKVEPARCFTTRRADSRPTSRVYVFKSFKNISGWYFYYYLSTFLRHVALAHDPANSRVRRARGRYEIVSTLRALVRRRRRSTLSELARKHR